ncbi:MAG: hypothetical protein ACK4NC_01855 [Candidatus Gracilibacteria bacterium]
MDNSSKSHYYLSFYLVHIGCFFLVEMLQLYLVYIHDYTPLPTVIGLPLAVLSSSLYLIHLTRVMRKKNIKIKYWKFLILPALISFIATVVVLFTTLYVLNILHKDINDYLLFLEIMLLILFIHLPLIFVICFKIIKEGMAGKSI